MFNKQPLRAAALHGEAWSHYPLGCSCPMNTTKLPDFDFNGRSRSAQNSLITTGKFNGFLEFGANAINLLLYGN